MGLRFVSAFATGVAFTFRETAAPRVVPMWFSKSAQGGSVLLRRGCSCRKDREPHDFPWL